MKVEYKVAEGNKFDEFLMTDQNYNGESFISNAQSVNSLLLTEALCSYGIDYLSMRIFALF